MYLLFVKFIEFREYEEKERKRPLKVKVSELVVVEFGEDTVELNH